MKKNKISQPPHRSVLMMAKLNALTEHPLYSPDLVLIDLLNSKQFVCYFCCRTVFCEARESLWYKIINHWIIGIGVLNNN